MAKTHYNGKKSKKQLRELARRAHLLSTAEYQIFFRRKVDGYLLSEESKTIRVEIGQRGEKQLHDEAEAAFLYDFYRENPGQKVEVTKVIYV